MNTSIQKNRNTLRAGTSAAVLAFLVPSVSAQDQASGDEDYGMYMEEIIVSATKRLESVRDVPLAITAMSGDFTREANLDDVKDLISWTPGITGNSKDSFIDAVAIRGIRTQDFGVGGDPSIGMFKNGSYQGRNGAVVTSMFDMERSEALRGPQNFLFGRNAISGAISVHTARPDFDAFSGYVDLDIGERGHRVFEGAVNAPISDTFGIRVAGYYSTEDGYVNNIARPNDDPLIAHDKAAVRLSADYQNENLKIEFTTEFEDRKQSGSVYRATERGPNWDVLEQLFGEIEFPTDPTDINQDNTLGNYDEGKVWNSTLRIDYEMDFATLTSATGYKWHEFGYREDYDGTPLQINDFGLDQNGKYFEQEFRLVSNSDGPLSWYAGVSLYNEELDALFTAQGNEEVLCSYYYYLYYGVDLFGSCMQDVYYADPINQGLLEQGDVDATYKGYAAYFDISYAITDKFDMSFGVRYSYDKKRFAQRVRTPKSALGPFFTYSVTTDGFLEDEKSWEDLQPRVLARYRPDEDNTLFASVTRGYKAGGFGTFGFSPTARGPAIGFGDRLQQGEAVPDDFEPESLWSYEVGHKGTYGMFQTDLNLYYYDYKDLQLLVFQDGGGLIFNLGNVEGYGVEAAINANLTEWLNVKTNIAYNKTSITNVGEACSGITCEGNRLDGPVWSGATMINAEFPMGDGSVFANTEIFWEGQKGGGVENRSWSRVDRFQDVTLRVGYRTNAWSVQAYIENLFDEEYYDQGNNNDGILAAHFFGPSRPRTLGVRLNYSFGK